MHRRSRASSGAALLSLALVAAPAAAGPVLLAGDAAEAHGAQNVYAGLLQDVLVAVTNGQTDILALGADPESPAAEWIVEVSSLLPQPRAIAFANDETISAIGFSGFAAIFVPSDAGNVAGGISQAENDLLAERADDVAAFLAGGGGLLGLTQGELAGAYGYLAAFADLGSSSVPPSGICGDGEAFDDVAPTELGGLVGITASNLDGCCWRTVFDGGLPEPLAAGAVADEPACPGIDGEPVIVFGELELAGSAFEPPVSTPAAGEPNFEAVGDLDGDGLVDVAGVIPDADPEVPGAVQVFLNQGNAGGAWQGLAAGEPVTVGRAPSAVAVGLFNLDPFPDLAVTNSGDDDVSILFNQGDGTFVVVSTVAVGAEPADVVAGDFSEDGFTDLAVANAGSEDLTLLFNDGSGGFAPGEAGLGIGFSPAGMVFGDFDGNKCPDLAGGGSAGAESAGGSGAGLVFVLFGQGGGAFGPPTIIEVGADPRDIAAGDLDGNGAPDLVTANAGEATLSLLLNTGGTFAPPLTLDVGAGPRSVTVADLNLDAIPDLAVAADDIQIGPAVQVLENASDGQLAFDHPVPFGVGADPSAVAPGDFDDNGAVDLVTVNADQGPSGGSVTVLLNALPGPPSGLTAALDIKPGGCPNPLNRNSHGVLPAALVGTPDFDAGAVDPATLLLSRADGVGGAVPPIDGGGGSESAPLALLLGGGGGGGPTLEDVATPFPGEPCDCHDLGPDGVLDLSMRFETDAVVETLELEELSGGATVELVLGGALVDGTPFSASDCVVLVPPAAAPGLLNVTATVADVFIEASPLDDSADGGGFADFARSYAPGTVVTLTAPAFHQGAFFVGWDTGGQSYGIGGGGGANLVARRTIHVVLLGQAHTVNAVYVQAMPY